MQVALKAALPGGVETSIKTAAAAVGRRGNGLRLGLFGTALGLVILLSVLLPVQKATATSLAKTAKRDAPSVVANYEARLAQSINAVRKSYGLRCLRLVPQLMRSANGHSLQMAYRGFFSHDSAGGASFFLRVRRYYAPSGYSYWSAGENLLWAGFAITPQQVVAHWLASPGHREVLLSPQWLVLGLGVVKAPHGPGVYGGHTVLVMTADFAVRR